MKLIGYARVSTRQQSTDRQEVDLLAAGVRHDDLYIDRGVSGVRASRPQFDRAIRALIEGDTLVITTLDRLGRSTQNMLALANKLSSRGAGLRVLNLGGGDVDTATPTGSTTKNHRQQSSQRAAPHRRRRPSSTSRSRPWHVPSHALPTIKDPQTLIDRKRQPPAPLARHHSRPSHYR